MLPINDSSFGWTSSTSRAVAHAILWGALSVGAAFGFAGCGEDSSSSGGCSASADCSRLSVCRDAACVAVECVSAGQCNTDEVCAAGTDAKSYCTPIECQAGGTECPTGQVCSGGLCEQPCTADAECGAGLECTLNICRPTTAGGGACTGNDCLGKPCQNGDDCDTLECISGQCLPAGGCLSDFNCPEGQTCDTATKTCVGGGDTAQTDTSDASDCTTAGCEGGFECNETTGQCDPVSTGGGGSCGVCAGASDCGADQGCTALAGGLYCLKGCSTLGDCDTGYKCLELPGDGGRCIPNGGSCEKDCIQNGCEAGKTCDFSSGDCVAKLLLCDSCTKDDGCGDGARCVLFAPSDRRCMPECVDDQCPAGSTCQDANGVNVCKPTGNACCFGEECGAPGPCDSCPPEAPHCWQNSCVECTNSTQCSGGMCNQTTKKCEFDNGCDPACTAAKPYCHPQLISCVECLNSDHCPDGELCSNDNQCAGTEDICQFCVDPYPACADINGSKSCVQCVQDTDCPSGQCDEGTYFCDGTNVPTGGTCTSDADCPTSSQFILKCHTGTGLCYDVEGRCDNVTAYCDANSGSECISIFDLLGAGGQLPPEIGAFGYCTCNPLADLCDALPGICGQSAASRCFGALQCDLLTSLLSSFLGGATGSPEFDGTSFCGP